MLDASQSPLNAQASCACTASLLTIHGPLEFSGNVDYPTWSMFSVCSGAGRKDSSSALWQAT